MRRIRVVLCVMLIMAMLAMSAGPAAAGSRPTSVLEPSLTGSKPTSVIESSAQSIYNGGDVDESTGGDGTGGTRG